jgi:hypothetical protein
LFQFISKLLVSFSVWIPDHSGVAILASCMSLVIRQW